MRLVCIEPGKSGYECIEPNQNVHWDGLGTRLVCIIASFTGKGKNAWFQPFAHARNFPEIWETMLFWYSSVYGLRITMLFWYSSV